MTLGHDRRSLTSFVKKRHLPNADSSVASSLADRVVVECCGVKNTSVVPYRKIMLLDCSTRLYNHKEVKLLLRHGHANLSARDRVISCQRVGENARPVTDPSMRSRDLWDAFRR